MVNIGSGNTIFYLFYKSYTYVINILYLFSFRCEHVGCNWTFDVSACHRNEV